MRRVADEISGKTVYVLGDRVVDDKVFKINLKKSTFCLMGEACLARHALFSSPRHLTQVGPTTAQLLDERKFIRKLLCFLTRMEKKTSYSSCIMCLSSFVARMFTKNEVVSLKDSNTRKPYTSAGALQ